MYVPGHMRHVGLMSCAETGQMTSNAEPAINISFFKSSLLRMMFSIVAADCPTGWSWKSRSGCRGEDPFLEPPPIRGLDERVFVDAGAPHDGRLCRNVVDDRIHGAVRAGRCWGQQQIAVRM